MTTVSTIEEQLRFYIELLRPHLRKTLLDAGCGRGRTLALAQDVFPSAVLYGVDINPRALVSTAGENLQLAVADLRWLPFAASSFGAVFSRDVLECVPYPLEALRELIRVVSPGSVLLLCHWDWDTQVFNVPDLALARKLVTTFADTQQGWMEHFDPAMGRKLLGLLRTVDELEILDSGVVVLMEADWTEGRFGYEQSQLMAQLLLERGKIDSSEGARWLDLLRGAQAQRQYLYTINHYWCLARRR